VVAFALVVALQSAAPESPARPNLTGRWVLDKKRSEEPKGAMGGAPSLRPLGGDELFEEFAATETLLISEDGNDLLVESADGRVLRLRPDGRAWKRENGVVETKTEWRGPELVAESRMKRGGKLTVTYSRPTEAREILVTLKMDAPQTPLLSARRVYVASGD
jgi:hypothetical protein